MSAIKMLIVYIALLNVAFSFAELLGPETRMKDDKRDQEEDEAEMGIIDSNAQIDPEYLNDINKVVDERIQELKDIIDTKKRSNDPKDLTAEDSKSKLLEEIKDLTKKMASNMDPSWLDSIVDLSENNNEPLDENAIETLPSVVEEEEPELTPEQQEAKQLYDDAMAQLNRRSPDLRGAILQIKEAAERGHVPAKTKLAWSHIYGEGVELDIDKAKMIFEDLAETGDGEAHAGMGFLYATGLGVPVSQAKAILHYWLGALGGSTFAQMALAYRYWAGHTVPANCPRSMELYMKVAAKVASKVTLSGGPAIQRIRILEEAEGAGSSGALDSDLIEYYQLLAEKGDVQAQVGLGQLHFQGGRGVTLDMNKALHYFQQAANMGNAVANAFLGKIYLEGGDGIKADNETALRYFKKAAELNNPVGQAGLGLMYLQGRGVIKDTSAAFKYFMMAANQGWVEGQLHLGFMYFGGIGVRRDFKQANKYFSLASQSGHVLAFYHLAQMHAQGLGVLSSCSTAVDLFKNVCERGSWGSRLMLGHAAWRARDADSAFLQYLSMAEAGYEVAQTNAAYLLDNGDVTLFDEKERWVRALQLWGRSAAQGYSASRVKLGDYHYYGLGTHVDLEAAAHHYRIASEVQQNAQAMFNLGYMHERGLGLARDVHLAKRCYDLAADASPDARLPAALALAALKASAAFDRLNQSIFQSPFAVLFLAGGDSLLTSNWDLYLITVLLGALGFVVYMRRPQEQPAN